MSNKQYRAKRREQAIAEGMCVRCWKQRPEGGLRCSGCRLAAREGTSRRKVRARELGLCVKCNSRQPDPGHSSCARCREYNRVSLLKLRTDAVEMGLCYQCRCRPVADGTRYCELHRNSKSRLRVFCDDCLMSGGHRSDCPSARKVAARHVSGTRNFQEAQHDKP